MNISMDVYTLTLVARSVYAAALQKLNWSPNTRADAARAFIAEANAVGLRGDDARWVANRCMSFSGYGGGV